MNHADLSHVQQALNHASTTTTNAYLHTPLKEFTIHVSAIAKTKVSADVTVPAEDMETAMQIVRDMHKSDIDWSDDYEPYDVMENTIEYEPWEEN